jgi:hypothetical protein
VILVVVASLVVIAVKVVCEMIMISVTVIAVVVIIVVVVVVVVVGKVCRYGGHGSKSVLREACISVLQGLRRDVWWKV